MHNDQVRNFESSYFKSFVKFWKSRKQGQLREIQDPTVWLSDSIGH